MGALADPMRMLQEAQTALARSRADAAAWSDAQRDQLDRNTVDQLEADARRLAAALQRAARDIDEARQLLVR